MKLTSFVLISVLAVSVCAQAQNQRREERRGDVNTQVAQACKSDIEQLCKGQTGQQAEQCLKNNQSKLSSQCKGVISKGSQQ
jgi:predicted ATP-dependent endonuclease of OLD family